MDNTIETDAMSRTDACPDTRKLQDSVDNAIATDTMSRTDACPDTRKLQDSA